MFYYSYWSEFSNDKNEIIKTVQWHRTSSLMEINMPGMVIKRLPEFDFYIDETRFFINCGGNC